MHPRSSSSRPTVARALELALRDAQPATPPPVASVATEPTDARPSVPASYFAPGDYVGELDWWAQQLAGR
jgi:hypothetical protein